MSQNWRLIPYSIHDAAENMAIDEAILDAHLEGLVTPTLRLYGWEPRAVSIGYGQKLSNTVESRMKSRGYDVVRRPTGGRAVLHEFELTYSFVGSAGGADDLGGGLSDSVIGAYKQICQGLILAFRELGVDLELGESSSNYKNAQDCFLATTSADLHYQGKKMIGSAQLRRKSAVLQHGSILLNQPQDLMNALLKEGDANARNENSEKNPKTELQRHANLFEILGAAVSTPRLQEAMKTGFESAFANQFEIGELTLHETNLAKQYRARYQLACSGT